MGVGLQYAAMREEVEACCRAVGRDPGDVTLVAVSKTVGTEKVEEAIIAGAKDFGENRPDELAKKRAAFPVERWHFIGNIQSRKIAEIVENASLVHSLYQQDHADKIDAAASALGKIQDVLIEVNVSGEASKSGVEPDAAKLLVDHCAALPHVRVCGLMTMAPQGDLNQARRCFEDLARLRDAIRAGLAPEDASSFNDLSMGMSEDWREAVASGATIVRIGRAIFDAAF